MQEQYQSVRAKETTPPSLSTAQSAVALPNVSNGLHDLDGEEIIYREAVKEILFPNISDISECELVSSDLRMMIEEAFYKGAIDADEVHDLIDQMEQDTSVYSVIYYIDQQCHLLQLQSQISVLQKNVMDVEIALELAGFNTDMPNVGSIELFSDNDNTCQDTLLFSFDDVINVYKIQDDDLPHDIQLIVASVASVVGYLCNISTMDGFVGMTEESECFSQLNNDIILALKLLPVELDGSDFIQAVLEILPEEEKKSYLDILEDYYGFDINDQECHEQIKENMLWRIGERSFDLYPHYHPNNRYEIKDINRLVRRLSRAHTRWEKTRFAPLLTDLLTLTTIIKTHYKATHYEYEFHQDCPCMSMQQVMIFTSHHDDFSESVIESNERYFMETSESLVMQIDLTEPSCLADFKNIQMGWLTMHCLQQICANQYKELNHV